MASDLRRAAALGALAVLATALAGVVLVPRGPRPTAARVPASSAPETSGGAPLPRNARARPSSRAPAAPAAPPPAPASALGWAAPPSSDQDVQRGLEPTGTGGAGARVAAGMLRLKHLPVAYVHCVMTPKPAHYEVSDVRGSRGSVTSFGGDLPEGEDDFWIATSDPDGSAVLDVEGYEPVDVTWTGLQDGETLTKPILLRPYEDSP